MVSLGIMKHGQNLFSFNFPHIKKCYIRMMLSDELEIRFRYIEALTVSISNRVPFSFSSGKVKSLEHCARNQFQPTNFGFFFINLILGYNNYVSSLNPNQVIGDNAVVIHVFYMCCMYVNINSDLNKLDEQGN